MRHLSNSSNTLGTSAFRYLRQNPIKQVKVFMESHSSDTVQIPEKFGEKVVTGIRRLDLKPLFCAMVWPTLGRIECLDHSGMQKTSTGRTFGVPFHQLQERRSQRMESFFWKVIRCTRRTSSMIMSQVLCT